MRFSAGAWLPVLRRLPDPSTDVALSYDDSPNPDTTPKLLDLLDAHEAKATFFMSGFRAVDQPDLVGETVRRGHQVYAHGWDHIRHDRIPASQMIESMERTEALLSRWRPTPRPYLIRLPYHGGYGRSRVHRALRRWKPDAQYAHTGTSWRDHNISGLCRNENDVDPECRANIQQLLAGEDIQGKILILHDKPVGIDSPFAGEVTLRLTELLLGEIDRRGFRTVPIAPTTSPQSMRSRFIFPSN